MFFDEVADFICTMINIYAVERNANVWSPLTPKELKCFVGIIILSGYVRLPSYKMYWEEALDVGHNLVKNAMPRNRFSKILRYIHFCDNSSIDSTDK